MSSGLTDEALAAPEGASAGGGSAESAADPFAQRASAVAPSDRLRSGYGSFVLAALAGAALFLARQRTRLV